MDQYDNRLQSLLVFSSTLKEFEDENPTLLLDAIKLSMVPEVSI
jgi:hypothetical protein